MERTLFVFEGEKAEPNYFKSLIKAFFSGEESYILVCFQNDIYELYKTLEKDEDLDPFEVIRELNPAAKTQESLAGLRRDQISQIYLFLIWNPAIPFIVMKSCVICLSFLITKQKAASFLSATLWLKR